MHICLQSILTAVVMLYLDDDVPIHNVKDVLKCQKSNKFAWIWQSLHTIAFLSQE